MKAWSFLLAVILASAIGSRELHAEPVAEGGCPVRWTASFGGQDPIRAYSEKPTAHWMAIKLIEVHPASAKVWIHIVPNDDHNNAELAQMDLDKLYIFHGKQMIVAMPQHQKTEPRQAVFCVDQAFTETWMYP